MGNYRQMTRRSFGFGLEEFLERLGQLPAIRAEVVRDDDYADGGVSGADSAGRAGAERHSPASEDGEGERGGERAAMALVRKLQGSAPVELA